MVVGSLVSEKSASAGTGQGINWCPWMTLSREMFKEDSKDPSLDMSTRHKPYPITSASVTKLPIAR